jgi:hypothetical protein
MVQAVRKDRWGTVKYSLSHSLMCGVAEFPTSGERLSTCVDGGNMWSLISFLAQNRVVLHVMLPPICITCSVYLHLLPSEFPIWMISARECALYEPSY